MAKKPRDRSGQYSRTIEDADVLAAVRAHDPAATSEIADELGITRQGADRRLRSLREAGEVSSKKIGAVLVWFTPRERPQTPTRTDAADRREQQPTTSTDADSGESHAESDAADPIGDALDGWEPDTDGNPRTARAQTRRAAEHLRSVGESRRAGELKAALADESSLTTRVWWEHHVRPGLNHLADSGLVEYVKNRGYRWVGA